jgi:hypothetical protein
MTEWHGQPFGTSAGRPEGVPYREVRHDRMATRLSRVQQIYRCDLGLEELMRDPRIPSCFVPGHSVAGPSVGVRRTGYARGAVLGMSAVGAAILMRKGIR